MEEGRKPDTGKKAEERRDGGSRNAQGMLKKEERNESKLEKEGRPHSKGKYMEKGRNGKEGSN